MPIGRPDFGQYAPTETIVGLSDLGELAARLGSVVTFDRRGNVILLDDFENGVGPWRPSSLGTNWVFAWDAQYPYSGGFCANMKTPSGAGANLYAERHFSYPVLSKLGTEVCFSYLFHCRYFDVSLILYSGAYLHHPYARWNQATSMWQIRDENQTFHDVGTSFPIYEDQRRYHTAKLVADFINEKYCHLLVDNQSIDLSAYSYYKVASSDVISGKLQLRLWSRETVAEAYIHHVIITQNEP